MSFADEKDGRRQRKAPDGSADAPTPVETTKQKPTPAPEFGPALRSAYQRTLEEDIPPEMLDLLGKLG